MYLYNYFFLIAEIPVNNNETSTNIELILALIAIIISISTAFFEFVWNTKINKINLEADFIKDIYIDYLMIKIPEARNIIHYSNEILSQTDNLVDVLNDIRRSSLFFKYKDKEFYKKLCEKLQNLEDNLVIKTGHISADDFAEFTNDLNDKIEEIYKIIIKKYIGKKIK